MKEPIDEEAFKGFETKIDEVVSILEQMNSCDKVEQKNGIHRADKFVNLFKWHLHGITLVISKGTWETTKTMPLNCAKMISLCA